MVAANRALMGNKEKKQVSSAAPRLLWHMAFRLFKRDTEAADMSPSV